MSPEWGISVAFSSSLFVGLSVSVIGSFFFSFLLIVLSLFLSLLSFLCVSFSLSLFHCLSFPILLHLPEHCKLWNVISLVMTIIKHTATDNRKISILSVGINLHSHDLTYRFP